MKKPSAPDLFAGDIDPNAVPSMRVRWMATYRLIPSRYPPINLFERVAPKEDWQALFDLESLTNPRLRDETGNVSMVPKSKRVTGSGASIVMAPFTHVSKDRNNRFNDGMSGAYYAGHVFETALREVAYHMGEFHAATNDPATCDDYRVYKGKIDKAMHDIRGGGFAALLDPDPATYPAPQQFAKALRAAGSNGIVYPSVRHPGGECIAAFWPNVVAIPIQAGHIQLSWDGTRIDRWFDFKNDKWRAIDPVA